MNEQEVREFTGVISNHIYSVGKAKILNIFEASVTSETQLKAIKRLVENTLDDLACQVASEIGYRLLGESFKGAVGVVRPISID